MRGIPLSMIGMRISGDLGPMTIYTDRLNRQIAFPKDFRQEKASPARLRQQERFRVAQASYMNLSKEEKTALQAIADFYSLVMCGQNLWISACLSNRNQALQLSAARAGVTIPEAPYVP